MEASRDAAMPEMIVPVGLPVVAKGSRGARWTALDRPIEELNAEDEFVRVLRPFRLAVTEERCRGPGGGERR